MNHLVVDKDIFHQDAIDQNAISIQTGNDIGCPRSIISNDERANRVEGLRLQDTLKQMLQKHDMHRPMNEEWSSVSFTYNMFICFILVYIFIIYDSLQTRMVF